MHVYLQILLSIISSLHPMCGQGRRFSMLTIHFVLATQVYYCFDNRYLQKRFVCKRLISKRPHQRCYSIATESQKARLIDSFTKTFGLVLKQMHSRTKIRVICFRNLSSSSPELLSFYVVRVREVWEPQ